MTLDVARAMILDNRRDQNRPRLKWLPVSLYRSFQAANPGALFAR